MNVFYPGKSYFSAFQIYNKILHTLKLLFKLKGVENINTLQRTSSMIQIHHPYQSIGTHGT